jgi:type IV pilus assembly protein PilF
MDKAMAKYIFPTLLTAVSMSLLSGCVSQSFENNEPIVKTQANRDEMAATRVSLGLGYLGMGNMSQAKLNLEKAKGFSPELVQVHTAFAHYYETVGEDTLASESFEKALSIKADSADTLNNYGVFLCRQGKVAAAEVQFLKAIAVPSYLLVSQSYENLASCYLQNDNFEKAEMYLSKAVFHSPNRTATLLQMVRLQYAMADYKEAKSFLQKFERKTNRLTADSLALAYKVYWKLGQRKTASNYAKMLVEMYPQSWEGKQYALNGLEFIDADNLAKKYQLTQKESQVTATGNKRVVKLSPTKRSNSPYTSSSKTLTPSNTISPSSVLPINTSNNVAIAAASSASVLPTATNAALSAGNALISTTAVVAGTAVVASGANDTASTVGAITPEVKAVVAQSTSAEMATSYGPTSTKPIPATRDVPLPEALPEVIVEQEVVAEVVTLEPVIDEQINITEPVAIAAVANEVVDEAEAFHVVAAGENLYSISVKYNVKLNTLRQWNNISEKNKIRIGDKLYVVDPTTVNNIND